MEINSTFDLLLLGLRLQISIERRDEAAIDMIGLEPHYRSCIYSLVSSSVQQYIYICLAWIGNGRQYAPLRGSCSETVGDQNSPMDLLRQKRTLPGSQGSQYFRSETVLGCNG